MANEVIALDPFGKTINLLPEVSFVEDDSQEVYDNAVKVIEKPAFVIELKENNQTEFFYLRSIGWNKTLLIAVRLNNGQWEAYNYTRNPSNEILSKLLQKGKQIL